MSKRNVFKLLDELSFSQIDLYKKSSVYQKISDEIRGLGEEQQKAINYALTVLAVTLPMALILIILFGNISKKNSIELKESIIQSINDYKNNKIQFDRAGRDLISRSPVSNKSDFQKKLKSLASSEGINGEDIKLTEFTKTGAGAQLEMTEAKFTISNFNLEDFNKFFNRILSREMMKITSLSFKKDSKKKTLNGTVEIVLYTKKK